MRLRKRFADFRDAIFGTSDIADTAQATEVWNTYAWHLKPWQEDLHRHFVITAVCDAVEGWIEEYYFSDDLEAVIDRL